MKYKVHIEDKEIEIDEKQLANLNMEQTRDGSYHIIKDNSSVAVQLISIDNQKKSVRIAMDGEEFSVTIKDRYDQIVSELGYSSGGSKKLKEVKAPMPGLILDVLVKVGQQILKGDQLLILEAMKMENVLQAEGDGIVKSIEKEKGDTVDKGQILIEME